MHIISHYTCPAMYHFCIVKHINKEKGLFLYEYICIQACILYTELNGETFSHTAYIIGIHIQCVYQNSLITTNTSLQCSIEGNTNVMDY